MSSFLCCLFAGCFSVRGGRICGVVLGGVCFGFDFVVIFISLVVGYGL